MADQASSPRLDAAAICSAAGFPEGSLEGADADRTPSEYFDQLVSQEQYVKAVQFLAHALPKRAAVWWGCLCVWHVARPEPPELVATVLRGALRWVLEPSEENRRAAWTAK